MAKRSPGAAAQAAARVNMPADNAGVKAGPGESRIQEPSVTEWDPSSESQETPPDGVTPKVDEVPGEPPAAREDKDARIRKLLSGSGETEESAGSAEETGQTQQTEAKGSEPAKVEKPPTRGDMIASLRGEKEKRALENQLKEERQARKASDERAEAALKLASEGDILSIAKARGLTADQAIDLLMNPPAEPAKPVAAKPADDVGERLSRLEQRERDLAKREALSVLDTETAELDIPVVRATTRVAVPDAQGRTTVMSGRELVLATAQRLWEQDGKPAGKQRDYIKEAAGLVEDQLISDDKDRLEAYAKKVGGGGAKPAEVKPQAAKKPAVPSVGTRSGGGTQKNEPPPLPDDPDERRMAIKSRLGWGS